ncbi:phage virion morphogenesis protein [Acinetobacter baumannii]|nr:phage virion morphogenesis protein [Acinetobacter baumannii]
MSNIFINDNAMVQKLQTVAEKLARPEELGHSIANSFLTIVEDNFDFEGRPSWAGLSPLTLARRKPGKILYQSGQLRRSIVTQVKPDSVTIGSNDPKAPTHHYGVKQGGYGKSRRGGPIPWGDIPARPILPMDENNVLQPEAESAIFDNVDYFYRKIFE